MKEQNTIQRLFPDCYYHIYNRGNNKENIFKEPENYSYFLKLWGKYIEPVAQTFCYCLLPNHFHFFVRTRGSKASQVFQHEEHLQTDEVSEISPPIERSFSNLFNAYAKAINKRFERTGSLFQERFRRKKITDEAYYTSIIGYITTNAVRHRLVQKVEDYPYCSYNSILSDKHTLLLRGEVLDWFGSKEAFIRYINAYQANLPDGGVFYE